MTLEKLDRQDQLTHAALQLCTATGCASAGSCASESYTQGTAAAPAQATAASVGF